MSAARRFIHSGSPWEELAGYARAVVDGEWIFVSGTVGVDFSTGRFAPTAQAQAAQALDTIAAALAQADASLADVVRVRVYVPDRADGARDEDPVALDHIEQALAQADASLADVVRVRVYVPDRDDVVPVSQALRRRLGPHRPTNTTLCCPLAVAGARVELEVTALCRR